MRDQLQQMSEQYKSKSSSEEMWVSKASNLEDRIRELESDLNLKGAEVRQVIKDKETEIANWREKFDMSERLIQSMKEAETRLKDVHEIEMSKQNDSFQRQIDELQAQLTGKEAELEKFSGEVS